MNPSTNPLLAQSLAQATAILGQFAAQPNFLAQLRVAFGDNFDSNVALGIRNQFLSGDFSLIPDVRVLTNRELGTANGAYAGDLDEIFVASDFLAGHVGDVAAVSELLVEEVGHKLDRLLNGGVDSPGDEGNIFRLLATGYDLSGEVLAGLRGQDDHAAIVVDGLAVAVERQDFTGTAGNDTLIGTSGNDRLFGLAGNDTLDGGAGDDTLFGGAGADTYIGGTGNDTAALNYITATTAVTVSYSNIAGGTGFEGDTIKEVETLGVDSGSGNDNIDITATTGASAVRAGAGDDIIRTGSGQDLIEGGDGNDTLYGGAGDDNTNNTYRVLGDGSIPYSFGGLFGGAGNDQLFGEAGNDDLYGGDGNDTLNGGAGNDKLYGDAGNDVLNGGIGDDNLTGGDGNDTYLINANIDTGTDTITETATGGLDTLSFQPSTIAINVDLSQTATQTVALNVKLASNGSTGLNYIENVIGGSGNDTITGNTLNNILDGGTGTDTMSGGAGDDTYIVDNIGDLVTEAANAGIDTVQSSINYTLTANVENLLLTGTALIGTGNSLDNNIIGNASNNTLNGGDGNDILIGGDGNDTLNGGNGNDNLNGGTGNDILDGGAGADNMSGGTGDDIYYVADVGDVVSEFAGEGNDTVQSSITYTLTTNVENLTLTGTADINGTGNILDNIITGNSGNNTLTGDAGNDTLIGGGGVDLLDGGTGIDLAVADLSSTNNNNTLNFGGDGTSTQAANGTLFYNIERVNITTGAGDDSITSGAYDDIIHAGGGNDTLNGGGGVDLLDGGTGIDLAIATIAGNSNNNLDFTQSTNTATDGTIFQSIERVNITTGAGNDSITAGAYDDTLNGGAGNDTLTSNGGVDVFDGGTGIDLAVADLSSTNNNNTLNFGGDGTSTQAANGTLFYNIERVNITTGAGDDSITSGAYDDIIHAGGGNDTLNGGGGNDLLDGGTGADSMTGGTGNDTYVVDNIGDVVTENLNEGSDTVQSSITYTLTDNIENLTLTGTADINGTGNALDNTITGNAGNNTLNGGAGNDTLIGGAGADTMIGGAGNDTYIVDNADDIVTEVASAGTDTVQASISYTLTDNVENLTLTSTANLNGTGNGLDNIITGNSGNNILDGGIGADTLIGGAGNDTYVVDNIGDVVQANSTGTNTVQAAINYTLGTNLQNLTLTGTADINGTGNGLNNTITGNAGNNILDGGAGADTMSGGAGNDTYIVDNVGDLVTEAANAGTDTVQSSINYTLTDNIENLNLTGTGDINGTGNALNNTITGNIGNNILDGGTGADTLIGGAGNDTYIIDNLGDIVTEAVGAGTDTVQSSIGYTLTANVENLILTGTDNINGTGNALDNTITGNAGNNILDGGAGNDTLNGGAGDDFLGDYSSGNDLLVGGDGNDGLYGGAGNDTLIGGAGNDTYYLSYVASDLTNDTIIENQGGGIDTAYSIFTVNALADNVENLTLLGTDNINGTGNSQGNTILGNSGNNILDGGAGNDSLYGGAGDECNTLIGGEGNDILYGAGANDTLIGGNGDDTYYLSLVPTELANDTIVETATGGIDNAIAASSAILADNIEKLYLVGTANINGTGNSGDNIILGNSGNNTLDGGAGNDFLGDYAGGNDTLYGGAGSDTLYGGMGNDSYYLSYTASDLTNDTIIENPGEGIDTAYSIFTVTALAANVENLTLLGTSNINGTGNSLDNIILGNSGNNTLDGGAGNDFVADFYNTGSSTLIGGEGNDILYGAGANDTLIGGNGDDTYYLSLVPTELANDTIVETAAGGIDNAIAASSAILADNIEKLYLVGTADINGTGNSGDNTILGNSGNNSLFGAAGNDFLGDYAGGNDTFNGGAGNDTLIGGVGHDSFVFSGNSLLSFQTALGVDTVADFTVGEDIILLSKGNFGSLGTAAGNSLLSADFATVTTDTATTLGSSIVYNSSNGRLFYDANGSAAGFGTGGQFAQVGSGLGLTGNDFKAIV